MEHKNFMLRPAEARFLKDKNLVFEQDPFVVITIGDRTFKTNVDKHGGLNPHWTDYFNLEGYETSIATVRVYDSNLMLPNNLLGEAIFSLSNMTFKEQSQSYRMNLFKSCEKVGEILLEFEPYDASVFLASQNLKTDAPLTGFEEHTQEHKDKTMLDKVKNEVMSIGSKVGSFLHLGKGPQESVEMKPMDHNLSGRTMSTTLPEDEQISNIPHLGMRSRSNDIDMDPNLNNLSSDNFAHKSKKSSFSTKPASTMHTGNSTSEVSNSGELNQGAFMKQGGDIMAKSSERYLHDNQPQEIQKNHPSLIEKGKEMLGAFGNQFHDILDKQVNQNATIPHKETTGAGEPGLFEKAKDKMHQFTEKFSAVMEGDQPLQDTRANTRYQNNISSDVAFPLESELRNDDSKLPLRDTTTFDPNLESSFNRSRNLATEAPLQPNFDLNNERLVDKAEKLNINDDQGLLDKNLDTNQSLNLDSKTNNKNVLREDAAFPVEM